MVSLLQKKMILEEGFEIGRVGGRDQKKYFSNWLDCALIYPVMSFATPSYALVSRRLRHWMPLHKSYNNSFLVLAASSACTPMYLSQQLRARFSISLQILCAKQAALVSEWLPVSEGCLLCLPQTPSFPLFPSIFLGWAGDAESRQIQES